MRIRLTVLVVAFLFLAVVPPAAVAQSIKDLSFRPIDLPTAKLIAAIVARIDETGRVDGRYLQAVVDRGASAILIATKDLDEAHPKRSGLLYEIIARAGIRRNAASELLRLYDPAAYDLYYTPEGAARQVPIAIALSWKMPPAFLPQAVVRAAPAATLAWLNEQAAADQPRVELLIRVLDEWSRWIAQRHERQFVGRLPKVLVALSTNDNITDDSSATRALLRCVGAVRAEDLTAFAVGCLDHSKTAVRSAACQSLGELGGVKALAGIAGRVNIERDPTVLASLAAALQAFPDEQQASSAALRLFQQTSNENVRRQLLFSLLESSWQDKDRILIEAFESGQGGVVALALAAIDKTSPKLLRDRALKMAATYAVGPPPLIDALGAVADDRASGRLEKWFEREKNAAFRLKIVLALQNIARSNSAVRNSRAAQAIAKFIERESNEDVMVYLVRAAGRLKINDAQQTIINLAESADIPLGVRAEAIWALGYFDSPAVRTSLRRMAERPEEFFQSSVKTDPAADEPGLLEQAKLYVQLARLKLGEADAKNAVARSYRAGTPLARMTALVVLGELGEDHPLFGQALDSSDFAVLLATVRAAGKVAPRKHHEKLIALRDSPFVRQLLESGLQDVETLKHFLHEAIEAGEERK